MRKHPLAKCEVPLTNGGIALIDEEDYERITARKWYRTPEGYAKATDHTDPRWMHSYVLRTFEEVDHRDGHKLDNRKQNLRITTRNDNVQNSAKRGINPTSRYKGVHFNKQTKKWISQICIDYKITHLGSFDDEIDAAKAYDVAVLEARGSHARTNF
jgi:frataxin-like iron-binding protein CyaY